MSLSSNRPNVFQWCVTLSCYEKILYGIRCLKNKYIHFTLYMLSRDICRLVGPLLELCGFASLHKMKEDLKFSTLHIFIGSSIACSYLINLTSQNILKFLLKQYFQNYVTYLKFVIFISLIIIIPNKSEAHSVNWVKNKDKSFSSFLKANIIFFFLFILLSPRHCFEKLVLCFL